MATLTNRLTSVSSGLRLGPTPSRRLLALVLCAMLVLGSILPAAAAAGEVDSEGEGAALPVEAPSEPDFDPGGDEVSLEEVPASGIAEEGGVVEAEAEAEVPATEEVTSAAVDPVVEESQSQMVDVPPTPEPETVPQKAPEQSASEPIANQSIAAPQREPVERHVGSEQAPPAEVPPPAEPVEEEAPSSLPQPAAAPVNTSRSLAGKDFYVVKAGDCLSYVAAALLPPDADALEIEEKVERLWRLNEDRIGTGDPDIIHPGTVLRLR